MNFLQLARRFLQSLFQNPVKVGLLAVALAFAGLLSDGTLMDLWSLHHEKAKLQTSLKEISSRNLILRQKIKQAENSELFIAKQAREKLDLVKEDELIFIFENENPSETHSAKH